MLTSCPYYKAMNYVVADMKVNLVITQWPSMVSNLVEVTRIKITTEKEDNISHQKAKVFHKLQTHLDVMIGNRDTQEHNMVIDHNKITMVEIY